MECRIIIENASWSWKTHSNVANLARLGYSPRAEFTSALSHHRENPQHQFILEVIPIASFATVIVDL